MIASVCMCARNVRNKRKKAGEMIRHMNRCFRGKALGKNLRVAAKNQELFLGILK